jgi:hypothetical protein
VGCVFYMCLVVVRMGSYVFIQCLGSAPVHAASLGTTLLKHSSLLSSKVVSEVVGSAVSQGAGASGMAVGCKIDGGNFLGFVVRMQVCLVIGAVVCRRCWSGSVNASKVSRA